MSQLLRNGSQGDEVRAVQDCLNHHIRRLTPLVVDGQFGPLTEARVREFQRSNQLQVDGIVGPNTRAKLFEAAVVPIHLLLMPKLDLTLPTLGSSRFGPSSPQLVPQLQWPGPGPIPMPLPSGPLINPTPGNPLTLYNLNLSPASSVLVPSLAPSTNVFRLTMTTPLRNDPVDPALRSYQQIVGVLDHLPPNFPFRASIIGAVPNPVQRITLGPEGFQWGVKPIVKPQLSPFQVDLGVSANAAYVVRLYGSGDPRGFNLQLGAYGEGRAVIDYMSERGMTRPHVMLDGQIMGILRGTF